MEFRKDINGLRAIAVMLVIFYHFGITFFSAGFIGVDVFFVISGFLMTGIIYTKINNNVFSIYSFYKSRCKRIIPPLFFMCFFVVIFGWFYASPSIYSEIIKDALSSLFFVSNFIYWLSSGYFSPDAKSNFLLHTWSLSTEWQFYLLLPLLLMAIARTLPKRKVLYSMIAIAVASLLLSIYTSSRSPDAAYYLLPSRAWEMMAGGIVFLLGTPKGKTSRIILSTTGIFAIAFASVYFSPSDAWPSYRALLPVVGASMVMLSGYDSPLLSNKISYIIGKCSYSIYLWHWVVLSILYFFNLPLSKKYIVCGIILSLICGIISYAIIEGRDLLKKTIILYVPLTIACATWLFNPECMHNIKNMTARYDTNDWISKYKNFKDTDMGGSYWIPCAAGWQLEKFGKLQVEEKCIKNSGSGGVFVIGDSHAAALAVGIRAIIKDDIPYNQIASPACHLNWDGELEKNRNTNFAAGCDFQNKLTLKSISEIKPSVVIIGQIRDHERYNYERMAEKMHEMGVKRVIIMGPVPQWEPSLPVALSKDKTIRGNYVFTKALRRDIFRTNDIIKEKYSHYPYIYFADILGGLCQRDSGGISCRYMANKNELMTFDYGHVTDAGSLYIAKNIISRLLPSEIIK